MTAPELLSQLKDIRSPPEPAWWPIAPGLYLVLFLILVFFLGAWLYLRWYKNQRLYHEAKNELYQIERAYRDNHDTTRLGLQLSSWLKRVARQAFPEKPIVGMTGNVWLEFLDSCSDNLAFTRGAGTVFGSTIYGHSIDLPGKEMISLCERWLEAVKPKLSSNRSE